jgi:pseudaminic acid cytidylyltransferase
MKIAVIPARGGSKRIPRKNIKIFNDLPIIAWSIQAAIKSLCFDRIIVSTDDDEIAQIAIVNGAEVPFMRPSNLSDDFTGTIPVIAHAIKWLNLNDQMVKSACCIYPTAPFIRLQDLQQGLNLLNSSDADYILTVGQYEHPIQRAFRITTDLRIQVLYPEHLNSRSQDLPAVFYDAGQFYWGHSQAWLSGKPIFGLNSIPIVLPSHLVHDIDTLLDWEEAEIFFKFLKYRESQN